MASCDILDAEITPSLYSVIRKDRTTRGGGVAIFVKNKIRYTILPDVEDVEALFCKLIFGSRSIIVGCVYCSPISDRDCMVSLYNYMRLYIIVSRLGNTAWGFQSTWCQPVNIRI